jgi:hypothetical protein
MSCGYFPVRVAVTRRPRCSPGRSRGTQSSTSDRRCYVRCPSLIAQGRWQVGQRATRCPFRARAKNATSREPVGNKKSGQRLTHHIRVGEGVWGLGHRTRADEDRGGALLPVRSRAIATHQSPGAHNGSPWSQRVTGKPYSCLAEVTRPIRIIQYRKADPRAVAVCGYA